MNTQVKVDLFVCFVCIIAMFWGGLFKSGLCLGIATVEAIIFFGFALLNYKVK